MASLTEEQAINIYPILHKYHFNKNEYAENKINAFIKKMCIPGVTSTWVTLEHGSNILITGINEKILVQKYSLEKNDEENFERLSKELTGVSS